MPKILTDIEMANIIHRAVHDKTVIDCADQYKWFLESLGHLICNHFGGEPGIVGWDQDELCHTLGFYINECVPADGGVFLDYDTDITWSKGEEEKV